MNMTFYEQLCSKEFSQNEDVTDDYLIASKVAGISCQCQGNNYYGMPSIQFGFSLNGTRVTVPGEDDYAFFNLEAGEFELFPKVSQSLRNIYCNLGFWNIQAEEANFASKN